MADTEGSDRTLSFSDLVNDPEKTVVLVAVIVFVCLDIWFFLRLTYTMIRHRRSLYCQVWRQEGGEEKDELLGDGVAHV